MKQLILGIIAGAIVGATASWMWSGDPESEPAAPPLPVRDIRDVPRMSQQQASKHREQRFANLTSVEEMLALPSDFDQTEALYVIAGRSNSAEVQDLIDQVSRVADSSDRRAGLGILFSRLADIDPESAVVLAGRKPYAADSSIEASIWRAWSRRDLDAALQAANNLTPQSRKNVAAQSIYGAYGYAGNDATDRIEEVLGIKPSNRVRGLYAQSLADDSIQSAVEFVNELLPVNDQLNVAWTLGEYVGRTRPASAESFSSSLKNARARDYYERGVLRSLVSADPAAFLDRYLANPGDRRYSRELPNALAQLAATDIDEAIRYFEFAQTDETRTILGAGIVQVLASTDPRRAIDWARDNDSGTSQLLSQQAMMIVAASNPETALEAANQMPASAAAQKLASLFEDAGGSDTAAGADQPDGRQIDG